MPSDDIGSALTPLPESLGGWEVVAAVQCTRDVSFTIRTPYYDPPCNQAPSKQMPFYLQFEIFYNPSDDSCLFVDRSYRGVLLASLSSSQQKRLLCNQSYVIGPGMWRVSVLVDEDTTEQHLVDFLMRERQFTVVTREGLPGTLTGIKRRCSDEAHVAAKRPKHQGNTAQIVLPLEQDFTRAPSKSVVASTMTARCPAVPATKILTRGAFSPFIDLSDGEEAVVRPNYPVDFMTATLLSTATSGVSDAAAYTLSREKKIICTDAAAVFTSRHSAVPQSKVVTKIIKLKGNKIEDLPVIAKMWKREKYSLERLRHVRICPIS